MENELKFKSSLYFSLIKLTAVCLLVVSIVCAIFGIFDFRTQEQKDQAEYNEFVSTTSFTRSVEGVKYVMNHTLYDVVKITKVSYTKFSQPLVLIIFTDSFNEQQEVTYIVNTKKCTAGSEFFKQESRAHRDHIISFTDEQLDILLQEASVWH